MYVYIHIYIYIYIYIFRCVTQDGRTVVVGPAIRMRGWSVKVINTSVDAARDAVDVHYNFTRAMNKDISACSLE